MKVRQFYVYCFRQNGTVVYVGKGSGRRFAEQVKAHSWMPNCIGGIVRYFASERAAYDYEAHLIAKWNPTRNANKGGGGAITRRKEYVSAHIQRELRRMERMGSRKYVARELLKLDIFPHVGLKTFNNLVQIGYGEELRAAC